MSASVSLFGDWAKAKAFFRNVSARSMRALDAAVRDEAQMFVKRAQKTITRSGGDKKWDKLSSLTIALRKGASAAPAQLGRGSGGRKPLVKTGDMRRSISYKKVGAAQYFAGVHRANPLANIAAVHEYGSPSTQVRSIPVTDKMRRFFLYLFMKGVTTVPYPFHGKTHVVIVSRPFMSTTMDKFKKNYPNRVITRWYQYYRYNKRIYWK